MATPQARTRPGQQARPGDVTGRKRESLQREHSEEIKAREGEIALVNSERSRSEDEDIIDPMTREVINDSTGAVSKMDNDEDDDAPRFIGTGTSTQVEELPDPKVAPHVAEQNRSSVDYLNEKVVIRVNADLEEVTLGYGNTFSFLEGRRYRVPRWVAQHLEEKGLTW